MKRKRKSTEIFNNENPFDDQIQRVHDYEFQNAQS